VDSTARYRAAAGELGAADASGGSRGPRGCPRGHRTRLGRRESREAGFRHSRVGEWVTGHRYPETR
jgi:hypothetical protein